MLPYCRLLIEPAEHHYQFQFGRTLWQYSRYDCELILQDGEEEGGYIENYIK
jgi:hypothetical protein